MQIADKVPAGSGADSRQGSGGFRCRWLMCRWLMKFRRVAAQKADEIPEGPGADG